MQPDLHPFDELPCAAYAIPALYDLSYGSETSGHEAALAAHEAARHAFEAGMSAGDNHQYGEAARLYFECAVHYRLVADSDPQITMITKNAQLCYDSAMYAYAEAGRFAAEGRAALEQAALDDPRLAPSLHKMLANAPTDCPVR